MRRRMPDKSQTRQTSGFLVRTFCQERRFLRLAASGKETVIYVVRGKECPGTQSKPRSRSHQSIGTCAVQNPYETGYRLQRQSAEQAASASAMMRLIVRAQRPHQG